MQALYLSEPWEGREAKPNSLLDYHFRKSWIIILDKNCVIHQVVYGIGTRYLGIGTLMTQAVDMQRHAPTKTRKQVVVVVVVVVVAATA